MTARDRRNTDWLARRRKAVEWMDGYDLPVSMLAEAIRVGRLPSSARPYKREEAS